METTAVYQWNVSLPQPPRNVFWEAERQSWGQEELQLGGIKTF